MAEYIKREAAVEKITAYCELRQAIYENSNDEFLRGLQTALKAITYNDVIPSADVQPVKRGKWDNEYLDDDIWWAECTACKEETHSRYGRVSAYNYCPNCGADMREHKAIKG